MKLSFPRSKKGLHEEILILNNASLESQLLFLQ